MGRDFKKLDVWRHAFDLGIYLIPRLGELPRFEEQNLVDQARRAVTSMILNISEGCSHRSNKVFLNHLNYSYASAKELEVIMMLAGDLGYMSNLEDFFERLEKIKKMIYGLMRAIEREISIGKVNFSFS